MAAGHGRAFRERIQKPFCLCSGQHLKERYRRKEKWDLSNSKRLMNTRNLLKLKAACRAYARSWVGRKNPGSHYRNKYSSHLLSLHSIGWLCLTESDLSFPGGDPFFLGGDLSFPGGDPFFLPGEVTSPGLIPSSWEWSLLSGVAPSSWGGSFSWGWYLFLGWFLLFRGGPFVLGWSFG